MKIGTAVLAKYFNGVANPNESKKYQNALVANFSQAGMFAFGQMPFIAKGPDPENDYDWRSTDALVDFGQQNNIDILYNTVINSHDNSFSDWYKHLTPDDKTNALKRHVQTIVNRYKEKVSVYKLVNEAARYDEPNFLGTLANRSKLIADIFTWAKEVFPEGVYILNDHIPFLDQDDFRPRYIKLIKAVLEQGAPIDAIGIEGHLGYRPKQHQLPPDNMIDVTLNEIYRASNLPIHITEFDLSYDNAPGKPYPGSVINPKMPFSSDAGEFSDWFEYQAYAYRHFGEICRQKGFVKDLIYWGLFDKDYGQWERPGIGFFDENMNPKLNLAAIKSLQS